MPSISPSFELLQEHAQPLHAFIQAAAGGHADFSSKLTCKVLVRALESGKPEFLREAVKEAAKSLMDADSLLVPESDYPERVSQGASVLVLHAFYRLETEARVLLLMRQQLEFSLQDIQYCLGLDAAEIRNRLRLARLHWVRSRELVLARKKRSR